MSSGMSSGMSSMSMPQLKEEEGLDPVVSAAPAAAANLAALGPAPAPAQLLHSMSSTDDIFASTMALAAGTFRFHVSDISEVGRWVGG